jgi:ABC-type glycerol-3-phosphate transport system substrate-binding protein
MDFMDVVACYAAGRAAMTIEPANEASLIYEEGGAVADGTKTALMPAGPLGTRHVGLYCPPYAIPSLSQSKEAAWELAKFLCAPEQVLADAQESGFVEVSRNSVLDDPSFRSRFRPDLVETTVASREFARGERPVTRFGMEVGNIIGDEIVRVLTGELTAQEAMQIAEQRVGALGLPG